jgi:hypothetical protein
METEPGLASSGDLGVTSEGSCVDNERQKFLARRSALPAIAVVAFFLICGAAYKTYTALSLAQDAGMDAEAVLGLLATVSTEPGGRDLAAYEVAVLGRAVTAAVYISMILFLMLVAAGERARRTGEAILWRYIGKLEAERDLSGAGGRSDAL